MSTRVLITGASGFIGHHVVEHILSQTEWDVVGIDRCGCSGSYRRLAESGIIEKYPGRFELHWHDFRSPVSKLLTGQIGIVHHILHLGASTHVDRAIADPISFVYDNVLGTAHLLEFARRLPSLRSVCYFSTDEVFGPALGTTSFKEWDRYKSTNPYSATKAGGEELAISYHNTYNLPVFVTHTMNVFGKRQHPEKFIPLVIGKVLRGEEVTIHADVSRTISGSRYYIPADAVASALLFLLKHAEMGDKYNIVGENEATNLAIAQAVASIVDRSLRYKMVDYHDSRPGHDMRYALDGSKLAGMGFRHPQSFEASLKEVVRWTIKNPHWLSQE